MKLLPRSSNRELPASRNPLTLPNSHHSIFLEKVVITYHRLFLLFCFFVFNFYTWIILCLNFFVHYYICEVYLSILLLMALKFFLVFGYREYCCNEHCNSWLLVPINTHFFWVFTYKWTCWVSLFFFFFCLQF